MSPTSTHGPVNPRLANPYWLLAKRCLDLLLCLPCLVLVAPLLIVLAVLVWLDSPGNPFFVQQRVGLHGKYFPIFKFRTLYLEQFGVYLDGEIEPTDFRVTRLGRYLRRSKIDELPQLLNVVLGHMSVVGPRPDIPESVATYTPVQHQRFLVKPGLTGVAQISGNIHLTWADRIALDRWYISNWSWGLDLRIILLTPYAICRGESVDFDPLQLHPRLSTRTLVDI